MLSFLSETPYNASNLLSYPRNCLSCLLFPYRFSFIQDCSFISKAQKSTKHSRVLPSFAQGHLAPRQLLITYLRIAKSATKRQRQHVDQSLTDSTSIVLRPGLCPFNRHNEQSAGQQWSWPAVLHYPSRRRGEPPVATLLPRFLHRVYQPVVADQ